MSKSKAAQIVHEEMKSGTNCCQAVLVAASKMWDISLDPDLMAAAGLFGRGIGSGCTCGALTGMVMAAGIMNRYHPHPAGSKLPRHLHDRFKTTFGATCCRVIRKKRPLIQNIGNGACIELTSKTAEILLAEWGGVRGAGSAESVPDFNNHSNLE
ncbi:MAG: C-GCAxxG-C-C family protein [Desulfosporosinus sp.]|jgi:C_GCAxxG_C_C family probable redox protein